MNEDDIQDISSCAGYPFTVYLYLCGTHIEIVDHL